MGDAVRTPVQAKMNTANPRPNSNNPKFIENWTMDLPNDFPNYKGIAEAWEKGEKYYPKMKRTKQKIKHGGITMHIVYGGLRYENEHFSSKYKSV